MSTAVFVECDVRGCERLTGPSHSATETRRLAVSEGWTRGVGGDYCPQHRAAGLVGPEPYAALGGDVA